MTDAILNEFKDVDGLEEIIQGIKDLSNSEVHVMLYKASKNKSSSNLELDDEVEELLQVKYVNKILKNPVIYKPPKTDVIIRRNFYSAFLLVNWIYWIHDPKINNTGYDRQSKILERIMSLLEDFDRIESFKEPNEEFYKKLKNIEWDKEGKTLHEKITSMHGDIVHEKLGIRRGRSIYLTERWTLIFLAACNAVNQGRAKILPEDIVKAYKTYFKLLNTDISKLDVYDKINQKPAKLNHKPKLIENPQKTNLNIINSDLGTHGQGIQKEINPKATNARKFMAAIAGIIAFIGTGSLIAIGVQNIWPGYSFSDHPFERLSLLFISFLVASSVYNMIKGEEPEHEVNEDQKITRDEVSKRLEERRNRDRYITIDKSHAEIPESKVETIKSNSYEPLNKDKSKIEEKTDLSTATPTAKIYGSEIEKNVYSKSVEIEPKTVELNEVKNEPVKPVSKPGENNAETVRYVPQNINLNQSNSCDNCGASNVDIAQYCAFCGSKLDLEYASIVGKFFALLIDWIILAIVSFSILIGISIIYDGNDDLIFLIWVILTIFIGFLYFMVFEGPFMQGQTIGKIAVSIRVVDEKSKETISYTQSFIRNLLLIIDIMPYVLPCLLGFIVILTSKKNQRIGDMGAKTIVIKDSEKNSKH